MSRNGFGLAILVGFCVLVRAPLAVAEQALDFESGLYQVTYHQQVLTPAATEKAGQPIRAYVQSKHELLDFSLAFAPIRNAMHVDQIFSDVEMSRAIFVKYGIAPTKVEASNVIFASGKGDFVFHGKTGDGVNFLVFFTGFKRVDVNPYLVAIERRQHAAYDFRLRAPLAFLQSAFGSWAEAASTETGTLPYCKERTIGENTKNLAVAVASRGLSCFGHVVMNAADVVDSAVWDMTVGLFTGSTIAKIKGTWEAMKGVKDLFYNEIKSQYHTFFRLPPEKQAMLFCDFAGTVLGNGAIIALTAGAGELAGTSGFIRALNTLRMALKASRLRNPDLVASGAGQIVNAQQNQKSAGCIDRMDGDDDDDESGPADSPAKAGAGSLSK